MEKSNVIVETERLIIRLLAEEDVPALALLWADEQVTWFMGGPRDFTLSDLFH
jgi:RimJ/RimL family protein N-acetyltransferase